MSEGLSAVVRKFEAPKKFVTISNHPHFSKNKLVYVCFDVCFPVVFHPAATYAKCFKIS